MPAPPHRQPLSHLADLHFVLSIRIIDPQRHSRRGARPNPTTHAPRSCSPLTHLPGPVPNKTSKPSALHPLLPVPAARSAGATRTLLPCPRKHHTHDRQVFTPHARAPSRIPSLFCLISCLGSFLSSCINIYVHTRPGEGQHPWADCRRHSGDTAAAAAGAERMIDERLSARPTLSGSHLRTPQGARVSSGPLQAASSLLNRAAASPGLPAASLGSGADEQR